MQTHAERYLEILEQDLTVDRIRQRVKGIGENWSEHYDTRSSTEYIQKVCVRHGEMVLRVELPICEPSIAAKKAA